jgi:serine/threonine-protein kinase HipA
LSPEGWLEQVLKDKDERTLLRSGKRYTSNITIAQSEAELAALPQDILLTRLAKYTKDGAFTVEYAGPGRTEIEENFERNLAQIYERADAPRLSGVQIKAPMSLDPGGSLSPATGTPFTHILKPAETGGYDALPAVKWMAMALGRAAGFLAPATALEKSHVFQVHVALSDQPRDSARLTTIRRSSSDAVESRRTARATPSIVPLVFVFCWQFE